MAELFEELHIGAMTARNRIVRAATAESLAAPDGAPTPQLERVYEQLARGGVGTIVTGYAFAVPDGKPSEGALGLCGDAHLDAFRSLTGRVHELGAAIVLQLVYGGSKSVVGDGDDRWIDGRPRVPEGERGAAPAMPNVRILGPSSLPNPKTGLVPVQAAADDLARVAEAFGQAASRARACGFDGVEVHAAHGYLASQFLTPRLNLRTDEYGGTLQNRSRFAMECVRAVRGAVDDAYPVWVKLNCCDGYDDPRGERGGLGQDESAQVAAWLVEAGASAIEVTGDWHAAPADDPAGEPYFADFGRRIAADLEVPVIVTGGWRRLDVVRRHLDRDGIAAIGMSRPLLRDPGLPNAWKAASGF